MPYAHSYRTGIVYEIINPWSDFSSNDKPLVVPRYVVTEGNGDVTKGFKAEWMAEKDHVLYIGGHGREFTDPKIGTKIISRGPMWVKTITPSMTVKHLNWTDQFNLVRQAAGLTFPGYLEHEAATWSPVRREWIFAPRRWSEDMYDEELNELRGTFF